MMNEWEELSMLTKIFYIGGLVSLTGLLVMILTGLTSLGDILGKKKYFEQGPFQRIRSGRHSNLREVQVGCNLFETFF